VGVACVWLVTMTFPVFAQSPPKLTILGVTDAFWLAVDGTPTNSYCVETSSDLHYWQSLAVLYPAAGVFPPSNRFELADGNLPASSRKFYRAAASVSCAADSGGPPGLLLSDSTLTFYEGGSTNFTVQLASPPTGTVTVTVNRTFGSTNININAGASLLFTTQNWSSPQTVTVSAGKNADFQDSLATLTVCAGQMGCKTVQVIAVDSGTDDEFVGPFASWIDAKRDFGAVGDGIADDTAALQGALNELRPYTNRAVLFLPAGTYRITQTLNVIRTVDSESKDIMIIGEDPSTTTLSWAGPTNGVMISYGAWFAKMSRLTLDGRSSAKTGIAHGTLFSSINEFSDLVFQDLAFGIEAGPPGGSGNAETAVERCQFVRCAQAGISLQNPNSLDWFVWNCEFDNCGVGVGNIYGAGNFHVYESLFRNSGTADISIGNTGYFSVRNNTSIGSSAFFTATPVPSCGLVTLQGNTVLSPRGVPIQNGNYGPVVLLDNRIQDYQGLAAQIESSAGFGCVGNWFSVSNAIPGGFDGPAGIRFDNAVACQKMALALPKLPGALSHFNRPVIELSGPTNAAGLQAAINLAATMSGQRPIVHLPLGTCTVTQTVTIPAGCDVQVVGDGAKSALRWSGTGIGPVLRLAGPSRATLRDFIVFADSSTNQPDGIVIENCDQPGARIFFDQANVYFAQQAGLLAEGLVNANVALENFYHSQDQIGVQVYGGGGPPPYNGVPGQVAIFGGASSLNGLSYDVQKGGKLLVRDIWYEASTSNSSPRFMICTNSGSFTLHGANISPVAAKLNVPVVAITNFAGRLAFITTEFNQSNNTLSATASGTNTTNAAVLLLGTVNSRAPSFSPAQAQDSLLQSFQTPDDINFNPMLDQGPYSADFLRTMLAQTRNGRPPALTPLRPGVTDVRLHRVQVQGGRIGFHLTK